MSIYLTAVTRKACFCDNRGDVCVYLCVCVRAQVNAAVAAKLLAQDAAAAAAAAGDAQAQQTLRKKGLIDSEGKTTVLNPMADDRFK